MQDNKKGIIERSVGQILYGKTELSGDADIIARIFREAGIQNIYSVSQRTLTITSDAQGRNKIVFQFNEVGKLISYLAG